MGDDPVLTTPVTETTGQTEAPDPMGEAYDRAMAEGVDDTEAQPTTNGRDDKGRFVANQKDVSATTATDQEVNQKTAPETPVKTAMPANWSADMADLWEGASEQQRERLGKWSQGLHERMSQQGRQLASYREVQSIMDDMRQTYADKFNGPDAMTPQAALQFLYSVQKDMDRNPVPTLLEIAQRYNALPELAQALGAGGNHAVDLQNTIRQLEARIASLASPARINDEISRAMTVRETEAGLNRFSSEKPFYADVEPVLPQFIEIAREQAPQAGPMDLLQAAYDMAVNAIPAVRQKAQDAAAKAAPVKPDVQRTAAAKKAASINVTSASTGKSRPMTEEETMGAAWDRAMSAA
jgi:hypothetical protein